MRSERKILRDCLDGHSRSRLTMSMALMVRYEMLTDADLERFSEGLVEYLRLLREL